MHLYASRCVRDLATQLQYAPREVRARFLRRIEDFLPEIQPSRRYPASFVAHRVTGFENEAEAPTAVAGRVLIEDLGRLLDVASRDLREPAADADEPIATLAEVSRRCSVCPRTLRRWRRERGLPLRWFLLDGGRLRLGVRESALRRFLARHAHEADRSARFSRLSQAERERIVRLARRLRRTTGEGITRVARRVAALLGRSPETVRYTLRAHDAAHPDAPVFDRAPGPLTAAERRRIAALHAEGVPVADLCRRYGRSRSAVYGAIHAAAVERVLAQRITYVPSDEFSAPDAERTILGAGGPEPYPAPARAPADRDPEDPLRAVLSRIPVLTAEDERHLFRRYNYLKYRLARLQERVRRQGYRAAVVKAFDRFSRAAEAARRELLTRNLRLVASVARRHAGPLVGFHDLVGGGVLVLMRAVDHFDYTRGTKFSTYATWALTREFARTIPEENYRLAAFATGREEVLRAAGRTDEERGRTEALAHLRHLLDRAVASLSGIEREVIRERFGLKPAGRPMTLREVGGRHRLTAERIRQIQNRALAKLRSLVGAEAIESLPV